VKIHVALYIFGLWNLWTIKSSDYKHTTISAGCSGNKNGTQLYGTISLQPYVTESCDFQQNVQKEIAFMTKASV